MRSTRGQRAAEASRRARWAALLVGALVACMAFVPPCRADDTAEATALFASGNRHFQAGSRASGARRARELEAAVADYTASLRLIRSRNVLFNAALALEMLDRPAEAFDHLREYLGVPGLGDDERAEATRRLEALRPRVSVLAVTSAPAGAEVWVDRRDLAPRGRTPCELAVPAGAHRIWLRAEGHEEAETSATTTLGATARAEVTLVPNPVSLQVLAPDDVPLALDGAPITAGARLDVSPGPHVLRLGGEGDAAIERRVELLPGSAPMVIDLGASSAGLASTRGARVTVHAHEVARVLVDNVIVGIGDELEAPIAPGEHELRVEAEGRDPLRVRRAFQSGERVVLDAALRRDGGSLDEVRMGFGFPALAALVGGTVLGSVAVQVRSDSDGCVEGTPTCTDAVAQVNLLNGATDTLFGVGAVLGITTSALFLADDGPREPSTGSFSIALGPLTDGAALAIRGPLGGAL